MQNAHGWSKTPTHALGPWRTRRQRAHRYNWRVQLDGAGCQLPEIAQGSMYRHVTDCVAVLSGLVILDQTEATLASYEHIIHSS